MRKIEKQMNIAVMAKEDWHSSNTMVHFISAKESGNPNGSRSEVFLHGNHIATYWHHLDELEVNDRTWREWPTSITRSRLRALGADVQIKNFTPYLNGKPV